MLSLLLSFYVRFYYEMCGFVEVVKIFCLFSCRFEMGILYDLLFLFLCLNVELFGFYLFFWYGLFFEVKCVFNFIVLVFFVDSLEFNGWDFLLVC